MAFFADGNSLTCGKSEIRVSVWEDLAEIKIKQEFHPVPFQILEGYYKFTLLRDASISRLTINAGDSTIEAEVKEKESALEEHSDNISKGNSSYLAVQDDSSSMTFHIGNIPSGQALSAEITYVTITDYNSQERAWSLHIPVRSIQPSIPSILSISLKTTSEITHVNCDDLVHYKQTQNHYILESRLILSNTTVSYACAGIHHPALLVQKDPRTMNTAIYLSYYPKASNTDITDWDPSGEFVILLDRSGSMSGDNINLAKKAVINFVKSLPLDSYFNVVSFGSSYQHMFSDSSKKYSNQSAKEACDKISKMQADMGGTNILSPLNSVFTQRPKPSYPLYIFLVTDGAVSDRDNVISSIRHNSDKAKVCTIGIGHGVDEHLVKKCAELGNGSSYLVEDSTDIKRSVISALKSVLVPGLSDISVTNSNNFKVTGHCFYAYSGSRLHAGAVLTDSSSNVLNLKYKDEYSKKYTEKSFEISEEASEGSAALVFTVGTALKHLEKSQAIEKSIEFQVLCEHTAFTGTSKNTKSVQSTSSYDNLRNIFLGGKGIGKVGAKRRHRKVIRSNIDGIPRPSIKRVARRGGVKRMSMLLYDSTRAVLSQFTDDIVRNAVTCTAYAKRKTVSISDVLFSLPLAGVNPYGFEDNPRAKMKSKRNIKDPMSVIVSLQEVDGHWDHLPELKQVFNQVLNKKVVVKTSMMATKVAVAVLKEIFSERIEENELIIAKALRWIRKNRGKEETLSNILKAITK